MARPFLSVIIPSYNEAERLPLTLIDIDRQLRNENYAYEIMVVVDEASSDKTHDIVRKFLPLVKNLKLIVNSGGHGKGASVKAGMLSTRGTWRLAMDADNAVSVAEFNKLLADERFMKEADVFLASRGVKGTVCSPHFPFRRRLAEWMLNFFAGMIFRIPIKDYFLGFHCYSGDSADAVFPLVRTGGWTAQLEAVVLASRRGFRIKEVPVNAAFAKGSHFKGAAYLQMFIETFRIWWWFKRGKYGILRNS